MSARKANVSDPDLEAAQLPISSLASLPAGWVWARLGDVCKTTSGGTPSRRNAEYFTGNIPWVKSGELPDGVVTDVEERITDDAVANSSAKLFPAGTLLIALYGATVGKLGILKEDATTNQAVCAIFPPASIDTRYLFWYLRLVRSDLVAQAISGAQPNISQGILRELPVPVAPLDQQKRIIAEIEKQFSRLGEAIANLKRVKANLKRYKAAVLKAAVEGRLVETEAELARREVRSYETGAQLLHRILETRRSQWQGRGKYKEPAVPDTIGLPQLPEGWGWASLDQLSRDAGYGTSAKCSYENEGPPVLRIPNVDKAAIDLTDVKYGPSDLAVAQEEALSPGDMLIIRTNGSKSLIGRAAIVTTPFPTPTTYASYLIRFRLLGDTVLPAWVSSYWQSHSNRLWIESKAATSAGQHNISMRVLATAPVPLPPINEQHRIVAEVDRRLSLVREVETQVDANLERAERLRQSVLQQAFSGKLPEAAPSRRLPWPEVAAAPEWPMAAEPRESYGAAP